ncbi:MAG: hypothetical protein A2X36_05625 [Elusimicrobia bacterium GWA2_69_24]|nr:MAG: hypothetical protein A2W08_09320 [Candidatus Rokubacteria bacterium RBG_16_73_20]OGR57618.1 MAG: hypothetical protein A2X36_05625 [Elusimicrobia bacterium GWA2_69_24]HBH02502.1 SAM-dependent methyltransferase [Candidatus Rokubacteria bacterium]
MTASPLSFRDPGGRLIKAGGRLIRAVNPTGRPNLDAYLSSAAVREFVRTGRVIGARLLDAVAAADLRSTWDDGALTEGAEGAALVEHERLFESFPYEWPLEMLHAAGALTLDLAEALLAEGLGLKDATPYNVLFQGSEPIFVDVLSFEARHAGDPTWLPYGQFVRTFVLPLLVGKHLGLPLDQLLLARRDGLEPSEVYRLCGPLRRLRPPFLTAVSLPVWLAACRPQSDPAVYRERRLADPERARHVLRALLKHLRRILAAAAPPPSASSRWSDYAVARETSTPAYAAAKQALVDAVLAERRPRNVLDVGCNTGRFSVQAARGGAAVVAIDADPAVVGALWREARGAGLDILPLVVDLARPSPAVGWRNAECRAFLDRARGAFDTVLMLAVAHHLLVGEQIPLSEIVSLGAQLGTRTLIVEFVAPADPMFRRLARGRDALFADLTRERFEAECRREFTVAACRQVAEARWLYVLDRRG